MNISNYRSFKVVLSVDCLYLYVQLYICIIYIYVYIYIYISFFFNSFLFFFITEHTQVTPCLPMLQDLD